MSTVVTTLPNLKLVLGGPGCGKTHELLYIVARELSGGVAPNEVAFVTFTRAGAEEAAERAAKLFSLNAKEDLPYFRTIHSLAYRLLGLQRDDVMGPADWREFARWAGYDDLTAVAEGDSEGEGGDPMAADWGPGGLDLGPSPAFLRRVLDYAANVGRGPKDALAALDAPVEWWALERFDRALQQYKLESGKLDFTDILINYAADGPPCPVKVAVIDEAQDLTPLQWRCVERAFAGAARCYAAGDDDQAIYHWAGADVERFLGLSTMPHVLPVSHRLPAAVLGYAQRIAGRIGHRYAKEFAPAPGRAGEVRHVADPELVDLHADGASWLLLARNTHQLHRLEAAARAQGVNYRRGRGRGAAVNLEHVKAIWLWEKLHTGKRLDVTAGEARILFKLCGLPRPALKELTRYTPESLPGEFAQRVLSQHWDRAFTAMSPRARDYYRECLRRGEDLTAPTPRIRIDTIHGVKGAEADRVLLCPDLSPRTAAGYERAPDAEHRVFYVGATRARHALYVCDPCTDRSYPL